MTRAAQIYFLPDRILAFAQSQTTDGVLVPVEPFVVLERKVSAEVLGGAAQDLLSRDHAMVPHPTDWKAFAVPRLTASGAKSERAFQLRSSLVSVHLDQTGFSVEPTRNGGAKGDSKGFWYSPEQAVRLPANCTAEELGKVVIQALGLCSEEI